MQPLPVPTSATRGPGSARSRSECRLDQDLGLRAWNQDVGGDAELVTPEGLDAGEVLQRLSLRAGVDERKEPLLVFPRDLPLGVRDEGGAIPRGDVAEEGLAVEVGIGDSGVGKAPPGPREDLGDRHGRLYPAQRTGSGSLSFSAW